MNSRAKSGGRQKGTPNRTTSEIREFYQKLIDENFEQMKKDLNELEPKDRLRFILELSKFVLPTLKATELSTGVAEAGFNPIVINLGSGSKPIELDGTND